MRTIMVVAGNMREFAEFKAANEDKYDRIIFVGNTERLRGIRNAFVTFYGTFYKRLDFKRIEEEVNWRLKAGDLRVE